MMAVAIKEFARDSSGNPFISRAEAIGEQMSPYKADVIVVGAGLVGLSVAYFGALTPTP